MSKTSPGRSTVEGRAALARPGAYEAARPYEVADSLDDLTGPTSGVVELPVTLDWGPHPVYDLDDTDQREWLYTVVVREAQGQDDLRRYLDRDVLLDVWPRLVLPQQCSNAWHARFPLLARRGTGRGRS